MPQLIRRVPWARQPPTRQRINRAHSLTADLRNALVFYGGAYDAAANKTIAVSAVSGSVEFVPLGGIGGLYAKNGSIASLALNEDWAGPCTVLWQNYIVGVDGFWGGLWAKRTSGTNTQMQMGRNDSSDSWFISRENSAVISVPSLTISGELSSVNTYCITNPSASASVQGAFFKNGISRGVLSYTTAQNTGSGDLVLGGERTGSAAYDSDALFSCFLRWGRVLSSAEVWAIGNNPWQLFAPQSRPIFFDLGAGSSVPTLSAATYVPGSITTSGFRPRVTAS